MAKQLRIGARSARLIYRLRRPSRYAQVGLICAVLSNATVMGLDRLGSHYLVGTLAATLLVTPLGFLMHSFYTYKVAPSIVAQSRFCAGTAAGSCMAIASMAALCDGVGLSATAAIPIATVLLFTWNYLLATWALIRPTPVATDA